IPIRQTVLLASPSTQMLAGVWAAGLIRGSRARSTSTLAAGGASCTATARRLWAARQGLTDYPVVGDLTVWLASADLLDARRRVPHADDQGSVGSGASGA